MPRRDDPSLSAILILLNLLPLLLRPIRLWTAIVHVRGRLVGRIFHRASLRLQLTLLPLQLLLLALLALLLAELLLLLLLFD